MKPKPSLPQFLPDLQQPMRDALRGVVSLVNATEEVLEPAVQLLPKPVRSRFRPALEALEQAGKRLMQSGIDTNEIRSAADYISGVEIDASSATSCAAVFSFAWEYLNKNSAGHLYLVSETIIRERLTHVRSDVRLEGVDFAAAAISVIRTSSAIGRLPGLARGISAAEEGDFCLELMAIAVWLLSARSETMIEEEMVLDLSHALLCAMQAEAFAAFDDRAHLARFLEEASAHL